MHDSMGRGKHNPAIGLWAIFITQFISFLFINARNIATPGIVNEFHGMALFSWLIALPALAGASSTLLFGKLSDIYGRRSVLLLSMAIFLAGLALTARSTSMVFLVAASTFMSIGHFPIIPLCFSAIGDLFPPAERAKWTGMLNLPSGIASITGPILGGFLTESIVGWRGLYWGTILLMLIASGLALAGMPKITHRLKPQIDILGTLSVLIATTTLIFGVSRLGMPGKLGVGVGLLVISTLVWIGFIQIEKKTQVPILDPQVLFNRTFLTAAVTSLLSYFGVVGVVAYSPIFVQSVMKLNPTISGSMQTPYTTIVAFIGIPAGFLLARTQKYKWIYNIGYALVTISMFAMWRFTAATPVWWFVLVTSLAGFGIGAIGTINTLVAQFAAPQRLLGAAVGAIFFFQMVGISVAPAILGLVQNIAPDIEAGLKLVFLVGAVAMLISLLIILTIPELPLDPGATKKSEPGVPVSEG
jgi:MFS family permease